jgi:hypothetical protein
MTMMMFNNDKLMIVLLWAWCAVAAVEAFTQHTHTTPSSVVVLQASNSRRNFFNEISTKAVTASLIMIPTMTTMSTIAGAEEESAAVDDLAMPSEEEAIKADVSFSIMLSMDCGFSLLLALLVSFRSFATFLPYFRLCKDIEFFIYLKTIFRRHFAIPSYIQEERDKLVWAA